MIKLLLETKTIPGVATFGQLFVNGRHFAYSLELEWVNNAKNISCIPAGTYDLRWHSSPKFGMVLALYNLNLGVTLNGNSQRTYVYFHAGNTTADTTGCILLGKSWNPNLWGLDDSDTAIKEFYRLVDNNPGVTLEIKRL
ncbi:hypothetical protein PE36_00130 [Moritella sp. PE36]|uniref:DUF5675 family protein n=1 Tax=Moritella sp. PE36 TaxID=58051 RepID=UPI000156927B|nr:DUF5675 family protein [Moritella sp. PE36]EDM66157.1 hypothetical protein PE36_00130 [Moritella sp. PE36]